MRQSTVVHRGKKVQTCSELSPQYQHVCAGYLHRASGAVRPRPCDRSYRVHGFASKTQTSETQAKKNCQNYHKSLPHVSTAVLGEREVSAGVFSLAAKKHTPDAAGACTITALSCKEIVLIPCSIQNSSIRAFKDC